MKTLICGDVHCKGSAITHRIDELFPDNTLDRIVFLGDYVDDWDMGATAMIKATEKFLAWVEEKRAQGVVVDLLCGNHDLAYVCGRTSMCSGTSWRALKPLHELLVDKLILATEVEGYLCTHAGLTVQWADWTFGKQEEPLDAVGWARVLNEWFGSIDKHYHEVVRHLGSAGPVRGGWGEPSVVWADARELMADGEPGLPQIVGHSPIETVTHVEVDGQDVWFCDTWSECPNHTPIGDRGFLLVEDGEFRVVA